MTAVLERLERALDHRAAADELVTDLVATARRQGHTWEQIADVLGVTTQAAWSRYRGVCPDGRRHRRGAAT